MTAAAKGLVAGSFKVHRRNGTSLAFMEAKGTLVPTLFDDDILDTHDVRWILVVEKEAVFTNLLASELRIDIMREGVLLTARNSLILRKPKYC